MDDRTAVVQPDHKEQLIQYIQSGIHSVTFVLAEHHVTNFSLVDSGVLSAVLNHLKRCEHESLETVATSSKRLKSPALWIKILAKAVEHEPSCRLQIAENVGPLVRCMCNDMDRVFFNSENHWKEGIMPFVQLITDLISSNRYDEKVVNTLLNHEGLLISIVQWGFWSEENRPDIANELNSIPRTCSSDNGETNISWIVSLGKTALQNLITDTSALKDDNGGLTNEAKDRLQTIGCAPIIIRCMMPIVWCHMCLVS